LEAKRNGKKPGGQIKIHGLPDGQGYIGKFHRWSDWTNGCIGITNSEMDELYLHVPVGTPIEIKP
jgi:murein L,D-transpeptidase YafK